MTPVSADQPENNLPAHPQGTVIRGGQLNPPFKAAALNWHCQNSIYSTLQAVYIYCIYIQAGIPYTNL